jgi:nucleoid-associated protein YgaU
VTTAASPAWNSTLAGIAQKEYGSQSAANINKLWTANQALIEGQEIKHGMTKAVADQRKWLYPGEVLTIP